MVRDLLELAINMVKAEEQDRVRAKAAELAEDRLLDILLPPKPVEKKVTEMIVDVNGSTVEADVPEQQDTTREKLRRLLREGKLDGRSVEVETSEARTGPMVEIFSAAGMEDMGLNVKDMLGNIFPQKKKKRRVKVPEAREILVEEEAQRLVDMEKVTKTAIERVRTVGDRLPGRDRQDRRKRRNARPGRLQGGGAEGSASHRGGVHDQYPLRHGPDRPYPLHRRRAFSATKPSDLIPELQGRFPIRVELNSLGKEEFIRILTEPHNALVKQYTEMMATEGVRITFTEDAIAAIADTATLVNDRTENIGARRLYTIMESLLDEISFEAPEMKGQEVMIDADYVASQLDEIVEDEDLSRYIL
jgi:ATP-dependent HslUV protease ATP-binding subunit HslU